jgi:hypothetical protein
MAERAAGEAAEGEAMMHKARKGDFLTRVWPSTVRTQRLDETEFLADVLRPLHDAIVKALAPHFHADDPELIRYAVSLIYDAGDDLFDEARVEVAIHDVYQNGAEAALRHVERAIEWQRTRHNKWDEKQFLMDVLRPFHAAIDRAMAPHFQDVFEGDDPADAVQYAVDLINAAGGPSDTFMDGDPLATAIHDVYRDGAEAALRHLGRVIEMYATFEARRRTERLVKEARRDLCG